MNHDIARDSGSGANASDSGNWLSAEQAVLPDGTQRDNLPLVRKKLPALAPEPGPAAIPAPSTAPSTAPD